MKATGKKGSAKGGKSTSAGKAGKKGNVETFTVDEEMK